MKANRWELDWLNSKIDDVLPKYMESLYTIHVEPSEATEYLASKMPALKAWASLFVRSRPTVSTLFCTSLSAISMADLILRVTLSWKTDTGPTPS